MFSSVVLFYRTELESLRKALEAENDVAMNAMKSKMIELQKKHSAFVDELRRKHQLEKEELMKHGQASGRGATPTPNMVNILHARESNGFGGQIY